MPHHLIDIVDYKDEFNVKIFQKMLREKVETIKKSGKLPIICGGTGLYIQAGLYNYEFKEDEKFNETKLKMEQKSLRKLQYYCLDNDIKLNESEFQNHKRLVSVVTKHMLGHSLAKDGQEKYYDNFQIICIEMDREKLYERINLRVDLMIKEGLIKEVKHFERDHFSQLAIGYKEIHE